MPWLSLARALECENEEAIWHCHSTCDDPDWCVDTLANLSGELSFTRRDARAGTSGRGWHASLIAAPFLLPPHSGCSNQSGRADMGPFQRIASLWNAWTGAAQRASVLAQPVGYTELCWWSPLAQGEHLALLVRRPHGSSRRIVLCEARVPDTFPQLMFLVGAVERQLVHPQLPDPARRGQREWVLREQMAGNLGFANGCTIGPLHVGTPAYFAQAVLEGLRLWLHELARRELVCGWQVHPQLLDATVLELTPRDPQLPACLIPLRGHQLRSDGIDLILAELQNQYGSSNDTERSTLG